MKKKVYIASPYTLGDVAMNVKRQIDMSNELIDLGYLPFAPLLFHFQHMVHPKSHEEWMEIDLEWLSHCDVVLRLCGESKGADMEVARARELGIEVVYSVFELDVYRNRSLSWPIDSLKEFYNCGQLVYSTKFPEK